MFEFWEVEEEEEGNTINAAQLTEGGVRRRRADFELRQADAQREDTATTLTGSRRQQ